MEKIIKSCGGVKKKIKIVEELKKVMMCKQIRQRKTKRKC